MGNGNIMPVEDVKPILLKPGLYITFPTAGQSVSIILHKPAIIYGSIDSTKSPASGIATASELRL